MSSDRRPSLWAANIVLFWAVGGVVAVLSFPVARLSQKVVIALDMDLGTAHWVFAVFWVIFMLYTEAWRGFHKQFTPRTMSRALWVSQHGTPLQKLLAPLLSMGYFHATRRRLLGTWILTVCIVGFVLVIHLLPQPWRGLVDLGVVLGLSAGVLTMLVEAARISRGGEPVDPEVP